MGLLFGKALATAATKELPKTVENIIATNNLPKRIKLSWSESFTKDFKNYNLYRSNSSDGKYKLIAKLQNNRYIDKIDEDAFIVMHSIKDAKGGMIKKRPLK